MPGITAGQFKLIIHALIDLKKQEFKSDADVKAAIDKEVNTGNINFIYKAADYLGIPLDDPFFTILAKRYAQIIHDFLELSEQKKKEATINPIVRVQELENKKYHVSQIAKQYFLKYKTDIGQMLGVSSYIKAKEMVDAGILSSRIYDQSENLDEDPNQVLKSRSITPMEFALEERDINSVKSLLKLGALFVPIRLHDLLYVFSDGYDPDLPTKLKYGPKEFRASSKSLSFIRQLLKINAPFELDLADVKLLGILFDNTKDADDKNTLRDLLNMAKLQTSK